MTRNRWLAPAGLAAAAGLAAGCGAGAPSPGASPAKTPAAASSAPASPASAAALAQQTNHAVITATSVHLSGLAVRGSQRVMLDVGLTRGGDSSGEVQLGSKPVTFVVLQGKAYIKVTRDLVKAMNGTAAACRLFCGKYVVASKSDAKSMIGSLGWSTLLGPAARQDLRGVKLAGSATVNGQQAWVLRTKAGGTVYVAARGTPYPLRITPPGGQGNGHIDFTDWNRVTVSRPPASKVVNASHLGA